LFDPVNYDGNTNVFPCLNNTSDGVTPCVLTDQVGADDGASPITATLLANPNGDIDETGNTLLFSIRVDGELGASVAPLDAVTELPEITNAATAVGNNQNVWSSSPLLVHDAQILAEIPRDSAITPEEFGQATLPAWADELFEADDDGGFETNFHTVLALLTLGSATAGVYQEAEIEAEAIVTDILNASVDNAATAVGNNASFTVEADSCDTAGCGLPEDLTMIADLTQLSIADVKATAKVGTECDEEPDCSGPIDLFNYTDLGIGNGCTDPCIDGGINRPIVANVATAVGNNLSIRVGPPKID
jgi:hypothetical protein